MSESTRRRKYRYDRVVIEAARILDPQFNDAVIFVTGAQIELLRNVTEYLRRLETYSVVYHLGYYLVPTVEEYDALMAIVANLEEKLMGNLNTIWGYSGTYRDSDRWENTPAGYQVLSTAVVAPNKVVRLEGVAYKNEDTAITKVEIAHWRFGDDWQPTILFTVDNPAAGRWHTYLLDLTMTEGDYIRFQCHDVVQDDDIYWNAFGREMDIPE